MMVRRTASLEDQFLFLPRTFHSAGAERSNRGEGGWILGGNFIVGGVKPSGSLIFPIAEKVNPWRVKAVTLT